jgi:hypothetical protein
MLMTCSPPASAKGSRASAVSEIAINIVF